MSKMVQIRHVPDRIHRILKIRSAQAGTTLSDYLLHELRRIAERPTMQEALARIRGRETVNVSEAPAIMLRRERSSRDRC